MTQIRCYGIDKEGDVLLKLSCGHLLAYPRQKLEAAIKQGAGVVLQHAGCGCSELLTAKDARGLVSGAGHAHPGADKTSARGEQVNPAERTFYRVLGEALRKGLSERDARQLAYMAVMGGRRDERKQVNAAAMLARSSE